MAELIYAVNASLDGYIEDRAGAFDWSVPTDDLHRFYNDLMRGVGTQLLGRRMYETMAVWETDPEFAEASGTLGDFAAGWKDSDKVVYSTTLPEPLTARTRIARAFDPDEVTALKDAATAGLLVGGAGIAAHALRAGLVDECLVTVLPVVVGGGKPAFAGDLRLDLDLVEERRFSGGAVLLRYRVRT